MDNPITRAEHEEFRRRMEDEHRRISRRLTNLEQQTEQMTNIALSVQDLASSDRLRRLEDRDGEMWRKVISYAVTVIVGILIGFIFRQIGM